MPRTKQPIEACILAGGLSSRMGEDKARMRLGGKTLLGHVRAAARAAGWPVRIIRRDILPRCGPLGGIYTALRSTRAEAVMFLSCDMPFVTRELLQGLLDGLTPRIEAVFIRSAPLGFPFILRTSTVHTVEALLNRNRRSIQALGSSVEKSLVRISRQDQQLLTNLNTPEEFEAAKRKRG